MANIKTIRQNFFYLQTISVAYLYLEVFIFLYETPNHFHVKKQSIKLPHQREKRILGS